ncbi:WD40 repeat domain-containing protein [Streptomyces aurantiacus]|uniref:WD40 repeat domain-containing protein n=1 Tax=Streptomyces aurantiacus TaxID=47760 RepID=UPI0006E43791|nr:S16 family serine protease [Streptomyces aurantiacus]
MDWLAAVVSGPEEEEDIGAWIEAQSHLPDPERLREALWATAACAWALAATPDELSDSRRTQLLDAVAAHWRTAHLLPHTPLTTTVLPRPAKADLPKPLDRLATLVADAHDNMAGAFVALQSLLLHGPIPHGRTTMVPVLFRVEDTASPLSATLALRTVPGGPAGLFPDPRTMYAARAADDAFAQALTAAWQWAHRKRTAQVCVVWSVTQDADAELRLRGASMGAPLAVALDRHLARGLVASVRRLLTSQKNGYAITGEIDRTGRMHRVGGLAAKLTAARAAGWHVIAPEENRQELLSQAPAGVTVHHASTVPEARKEVDAFKKTVVAVSTAFVLLLVTAGVFLQQRLQADDNAAAANRGKVDQRLLADAADARANDPQLALRLGATALARKAPGARAALIDTLTSTQYAGTTGIPSAAHLLTASHRDLLASVQEHTITLWRTGNRPHRKSGTITHARGGFGTAFSSDARTLAVTHENGSVVLWDISDPDKPERRSPLALNGKRVDALGVALSPDGRLMAVSETDRHMGLWDISRVSAPRLVGRTQIQYGGFIDQLSFSADGRRMVTSAFDDQDPPASYAWDLADPRRPRVGGLIGSSASMAVGSPTGTLAAVIDGYGKTTLWDITDTRTPRALGPPLTDHTSRVETVAFSPDGNVMATGGKDHKIFLYDLARPESPAKYATLEAHRAPVTSLVFSPDGRTLTSASGKQTLRWSVRHPSTLRTLSTLSTRASNLVIAPNRRTLLTTFVDGTVWNLDRRGRATRRGALPKDVTVSAAKFSPDGRLLVVLSSIDISRDIGVMDVYDVDGTAMTRLSSTPRTATVDDEALSFSADGRTLALPDDRHHVGLWDLSDPRRPVEKRSLTGQHTYLSMLQFSPDGSRLAGLGDDGTLIRWACRTGQKERTRAVGQKLPSPVYNSEGERIDYGDVLGTPLDSKHFITQQEAEDQVWSWGPSEEFTQTSSARPGFFGSDADGPLDVRGIQAVSADGKLALTEGPNSQLRAWDLHDFAAPVQLTEFTPADPQTSGLTDVTLSRDGSLLFIATQDDVQVRDIAPLKRIADDPTGFACRLADGGLTEGQWDHYLPDDTYETPCPAAHD